MDTSCVEKNNLDYILFALKQMHAALSFEFTKNECRRNLYTALHQYWQHKEMNLHATSQKKRIPRSKSAKTTTGKTRVEHVVPLKVIVDLLLKIKQPTNRKVRNILKKFYRVCIVTVHEHQQLTDAGLRSKMPDDWDGADPFARYKVVGIDVDYDEF